MSAVFGACSGALFAAGSVLAAAGIGLLERGPSPGAPAHFSESREPSAPNPAGPTLNEDDAPMEGDAELAAARSEMLELLSKKLSAMQDRLREVKSSPTAQPIAAAEDGRSHTALFLELHDEQRLLRARKASALPPEAQEDKTESGAWICRGVGAENCKKSGTPAEGLAPIPPYPGARPFP